MTFHSLWDKTKKRRGQLTHSIYNHSLFLFTPILILFLSKPFILNDGQKPQTYNQTSTQITFLFIGDIMQHMPQVESAWNDSLGKYSYDSTFQYVKPIISSYDFSIANLETTLAGKPYSGYPAFSSPDELVNGLLYAGIDIVGTANNHCCDRGKIGIERTLKVLDSMGMKHFGTYMNYKEATQNHPFILRKNGISIALLNYTYGTNGITVPEKNIVNLIEKERIAHDIKVALSQHPDKVILFLHWGTEYEREPNEYQKDIARFCFDQGADIIIGSHPHVIQAMEWHKKDSLQKEKLLVWSLGNFVSNQRNRYTDGGAMVGFTIKKENDKTSIQHVDYQLNWVYNPVRYGKKQYYIMPVKRFEKDSSILNIESYDALKLFSNDSRQLLRRNLNIPEK